LINHIKPLLSLDRKTSVNSQLQAFKTDQKQDANANLLQQLTEEQAGMVEKISLIPTA
jgi:hypothetical protein